MTKFTTILFLSLFLFSCNSEKKEATNEQTVAQEETCTYSVGKDLKLEWTAFKTTEKLAVKGSFDTIDFKNDRKETMLTNLIIETKFEIKTNSINSGNPDRDKKLKEIFFKNFDSSETIMGTIEECEGDNLKGKAIANLTMNNNSHQIMLNYTVENDTLKLHGGFDLLNWNAEKSIDELHKACLDLHKGADGVSKTWSTMEIDILVPIKKECK